MNGILGSNKTRILLLFFAGLLLFSTLGLSLYPVAGQEELDLSWTFDYSPLVSGASNSLQIGIVNTALAPVRLLSLGIRFPWTENGTYLSSGTPATWVDIGPGEQVQYTIPLQIPADTLTGRYAMNTLVQYEPFQNTQYGAAEAIVYLQYVAVLGRNNAFSMTFDPYDGRFDAAFAVFTLLGWYLPKRLLRRTKG